MIESLVVILIGFGCLFYFMREVNKKVDEVNRYQLREMKREYNVLLRSARDYQANTSQLKKAINELQKDIDTLNKAREDSNIFSINKKKK